MTFKRTTFGLLMLFGLLVTAHNGVYPVAGEANGGDIKSYVPLVLGGPDSVACPGSSGRSYSSGIAYQFDLDNPVRPAALHADKNIDLRSYSANNDAGLRRELVDYGSDDPTQPPQFATMFSPTRVPPLIGFYRIHKWNWAPSPNPGTRGGPNLNPPTTALGIGTTPGEALKVPQSGYEIGGGMEVLVLHADSNSVALRYTRDDSSAPGGYTVHVDQICTDPNLLALYNQRNSASGPRYVYRPPNQRPYGYNLPNMPAGAVFGTATAETVIAIVDSGTFMDPRSCHEWWQIRPGYPGSCPPAWPGAAEKVDLDG